MRSPSTRNLHPFGGHTEPGAVPDAFTLFGFFIRFRFPARPHCAGELGRSAAPVRRIRRNGNHASPHTSPDAIPDRFCRWDTTTLRVHHALGPVAAEQDHWRERRDCVSVLFGRLSTGVSQLCVRCADWCVILRVPFKSMTIAVLHPPVSYSPL